MTRRLSIFVLVYLLTASPSLAQAPWVQANMKPFDPWIGVTFWIDPAFAAQEPFLFECMRQGLQLWNTIQTPVNFTTNILQANVKVLHVNPDVCTSSPTSPNGFFSRQTD